MAIDTRPELADLAPVAPAGRDAHRDFAEKVAGTLRYADDWTLPGMLHGVVVRSSVACGVIRNVDVARARAVEGVRAVMTAADVPHNVVV